MPRQHIFYLFSVPYSDQVSVSVSADGPLNVMISGPDKAKVGSSVSLTCSAETQPDCDFNWFFNNPLSQNVKAGPVITFSVTKENEGIYVCKARNPVTKIEVLQFKTFMVIGE